MGSDHGPSFGRHRLRTRTTPVVATGAPPSSHCSRSRLSGESAPDRRSIRGALPTSTMPFAEQSRAAGTEAYPALQGEDAPVGLVLIDEALQSGVDDLDLPAHACEPPCALDEIVPQVDYCPYHDIGLAAGDIIVNVGPLSGSPSRIPVVVDATP